MCGVQAEKVKSQCSSSLVPGPTLTTGVFTFELLPKYPEVKKGGFA